MIKILLFSTKYIIILLKQVTKKIRNPCALRKTNRKHHIVVKKIFIQNIVSWNSLRFYFSLWRKYIKILLKKIWFDVLIQVLVIPVKDIFSTFKHLFRNVLGIIIRNDSWQLKDKLLSFNVPLKCKCISNKNDDGLTFCSIVVIINSLWKTSMTQIVEHFISIASRKSKIE